MVKLKKYPADYACPDWLPNWENKGEYIEHDSPWIWAWEFLRRNTKYQVDYAHFDSVPWFWSEEGGHTPKGCGRGYNDESPMIYFHGNPPALEGETLGEYNQRTDYEGEYVNLECHLIKKWGVDPICAPADTGRYIHPGSDILDSPPMSPPFELVCEHTQLVCSPNPDRWAWQTGVGAVITNLEARAAMRWYEEDGVAPDLRADDYVIFAFDLRRDPKQQTEEVYQMLVDARKRRIEDGVQAQAKKTKTGPQWSKKGYLINVLRAYDATLCGVTDKKEIAKTLFNGTDRTDVDRVNRNIAEAKKLIDGDYKKLLIE